MSISPGQRIGRNLVLLHPIGQGGMATVWVAEARAGKRRVAVKILDAQVVENAQAVERFMSEASAMARIRSPFVPEIYECGRLSDGTPYTVMELLDGVDLDVHLRSHGVLSLRATARLVTQIGAALTEAHGLGIVHRDVKAENIFVAGRRDQLRAKLIDFGIAKIPTDKPGRHGTQMATMGTPAYMSPEQLSSTKDVDSRADLWSLAVVAYLALTGKTPFDGDTFLAVCLSIHQGIFDLPSHLRSELPVEVDAWLSKALHRDPGQRFQTARELSDALATIARRSRPPTPVLELTLEPETGACIPVEGVRASLDGVSRTRSTARAPRRWRNVALVAACACLLAVWSAAPHMRETSAASHPSPAGAPSPVPVAPRPSPAATVVASSQAPAVPDAIDAGRVAPRAAYVAAAARPHPKPPVMAAASVPSAASVAPETTDGVAPRWSASDRAPAITPDAGGAPPASPIAETITADASPGGAEGD
jgi:serine/threonine-protein kinase